MIVIIPSLHHYSNDKVIGMASVIKKTFCKVTYYQQEKEEKMKKKKTISDIGKDFAFKV